MVAKYPGMVAKYPEFLFQKNIYKPLILKLNNIFDNEIKPKGG